MRSIPAPTIDVTDVYNACVGMVQDTGLRRRLKSIAAEIISSEKKYRQLARAGRTHEHATEEVVSTVTREELEKLYTHRMAKRKTAARPYYDQIRLLAKYGICPFCGERPVKTLDHYLAKSKYPRFVVTPVNLVPCCSDCNKEKSDAIYTTNQALPFHPYFDSVDGFIWLKARVVEVKPPALLFVADPPAGFDPVLRDRIRNHFTDLGLAGLYTTKSAEELSQVSFHLDLLRQRASPEEVQRHLREQAVSRRQHFQNTWQAAMYDALADSDWFCRGGYLE